jgi:hypothetical protein
MKDTSYAVLFDKKDMPAISNYAKMVRQTHDPILVDNFNNTIEKIWNDHRNHGINGGIEPWQVEKTDDLVVSVGAAQIIDQITGASTTRFSHVGYGNGGATAVTAAQTTLVAELGTRASMATNGWREYAGASLRFAGIFGESTSSVSLDEMGIFTAITGGIMLNRNSLSGAQLEHITNTSIFVISSIIEFVPIV